MLALKRGVKRWEEAGAGALGGTDGPITSG
jgi:hypothetical protein